MTGSYKVTFSRANQEYQLTDSQDYTIISATQLRAHLGLKYRFSL